MRDIEQMRPNPTGTNVMSAINWYNKIFRTREASKRALFIVTQTKFSDNINTLKAAVRRIQGMGVRVFSIGLGDKVDKTQINNLVNNQKDFSLIEPISHFPIALMSLQFALLRRMSEFGFFLVLLIFTLVRSACIKRKKLGTLLVRSACIKRKK